jgi:hypothetical protein
MRKDNELDDNQEWGFVTNFSDIESVSKTIAKDGMKGGLIKRIEKSWNDADQMSVCGYCRDCKWWKVYSMWRICELMEGDPEGGQVHPESKAKGDNVETEPDFGCVQFKAKESEG